MGLKYRLMSDLHLEFLELDVPTLQDEDKMTLVLAGDVAVAAFSDTYVDFINEMCSRHANVIWVLGNHEYYNNYWEETLDEILENLHPVPENLDVVETGVVIIEDVAFVCATLWTDYNKNNPHSLLLANNAMNDHRRIQKYGDATTASTYSSYVPKFEAKDAYGVHLVHRDFIFKKIDELDVRKVVVVTHHAPSHLSIHPDYADDLHMNGAYFSDLSEQILDRKIDMWHHGHSHFSFDYKLGECHVVTNPRGYVKKNYATSKYENENSDFDPSLVIEV